MQESTNDYNSALDASDEANISKHIEDIKIAFIPKYVNIENKYRYLADKAISLLSEAKSLFSICFRINEPQRKKLGNKIDLEWKLMYIQDSYKVLKNFTDLIDTLYSIRAISKGLYSSLFMLSGKVLIEVNNFINRLITEIDSKSE